MFTCEQAVLKTETNNAEETKRKERGRKKVYILIIT
jgi:hypothetical protein